MPAMFFPPPDASEAMSNWITKPAAWMDWCRTSQFGMLRQIARAEPVIKRVASSAIVAFTAPMDLLYNVIWLTIETGAICSKPVLMHLLGPEHSSFYRDVTVDRLAIRGKKCAYYSTAMLLGPMGALIAPDKVHSIYRERKLVITDDKSYWNLFLEQLRSGQQLALRKVEEGTEYVRKHPKKTATALTLAALGMQALRLRKVL